MQPAQRPSVDVVVPFAGAGSELPALAERMAGLVRAEGDRVWLVDNRPAGEPAVEVAPTDGLAVLRLPSPQGSYAARNHGAGAGAAPWLVFLDADVVPDADLLERYFEPPPGDRTGVLAGELRDVLVEDTAVARFIVKRRWMAQDQTLEAAGRAYAQTANCAVRRTAFAAVDGFEASARSGGDADLCFRLHDAGWALERRPGAVAEHAARAALRSFVGQLARHGSGAAWLDSRYPGHSPSRLRRGLLKVLARGMTDAVGQLARRDREAAADAILPAVTEVAFELGRLLTNEVPTGQASWRRRDRWLR